MKDNIELMPCPFCGEKEIIFKQHKKDGYQIRCPKCCIKLEQRTLKLGLDWLKEKMITSWNTRK